LIYQGLEEENLDQKSPGPPGLGLMQRSSSSLMVKKQEMLKEPNTKLRKSRGWNDVWFSEDGDSCYKTG